MRSSCFCCSCLSLPCAFESNPSSLLLRLAIGWLVLPEWPDWEYIKQTGRFVLIFACLMPTMTLVRATAMTMPSVRRTQDRLVALLPEHTASGLQLTSQMLGAVMNVGAFALVSAALPKNAMNRRLVAAQAAIRGMNAAVLWSPFFISFAVAGFYLPAGFASGAISLGVVDTMLFFVITSAIAAPARSRFALWQSLHPLFPIASRLFFAIFCVIIMSLTTGLTALYAIVATMPLLCIFQMLRRPDTFRPIISNFLRYKNMGMSWYYILIQRAFLAGQTDYMTAMLTGLFGGIPDTQLMLFALPVIVWVSRLSGRIRLSPLRPCWPFLRPASASMMRPLSPRHI